MTALARETPVRYVRLAKKTVVVVGALAGTGVLHNFTPDSNTGSSCMACFGWVTDPQHPLKKLKTILLPASTDAEKPQLNTRVTP